MARLAVVLMNLGGPDAAEAVAPFLFNLFSDPAIIALPNPLRWLIAKFIARQRAPIAQQIYAKIGNVSPLLANTVLQARALEAALGAEARVFVAMRYWHPFAHETARDVKAWGAEEIVLLPLYPQFSSTTTASSLADWQRAAKRAGITAPVHAICCAPDEPGFIAALVENIRLALTAWPRNFGAPRLLLSAHGLPKRVVARGDPYQSQVEMTAAALRHALNAAELESVVCYQSRVGPLEWLSPGTDAEIRRAGAERRGLIVAPIAFVSEHSETLVELDIEYRDVATQSGVPHYVRVPTVATTPSYIGGLAKLVREARAAARPIIPAVCGGLRPLSLRRGMNALVPLYPWIKALHIISVVAWMAGLLYLPRLFVYHASATPGSEASETFKVMERRLLRGIMHPALVMTYGFGILLALTPGVVDWRAGWIHAKLGLVVALTALHYGCARWRRAFAADRNPHDARFYRIVNEVPTLILVAIVILVVVKPF
jgi:protoporphyrin/coproporphyrin ferrochelatase